MTVPGYVEALVVLPNGDLVAGGLFFTAGGVPARHVARWDGGAWSAYGAGIYDWVNALAVLPNGNLVAGGHSGVAVWNGSTWSYVLSGMYGAVRELLTLPNGDLIAGGGFTVAAGGPADRIARWNGSTWAPLGTGTNHQIWALARLPNGDLVAGGQFTMAGGVPANYVAQWDGSAWSALGTGVGGSSSIMIRALVVMPNGDLIAGGHFATAGGAPAHNVARWNGSAWTALGSGIGSETSGMVEDFTVLANGDLVAAGNFSLAGGISALAVARWNGSTWASLGMYGTNTADAVAVMPNGDIVAGGPFTTAGGAPGNLVARRTGCTAQVTPLGAGCPSSGGSNTLTALSLPWIGTTFHARGTGLPAVALVAVVSGFAPISLPLSSVLPQGQPGCILRVSPDIVEFFVPMGGTLDSQIVLPNDPAVVGEQFHHQFVPFEIEAAIGFVAITATNALTLTVGGI